MYLQRAWIMTAENGDVGFEGALFARISTTPSIGRRSSQVGLGDRTLSRVSVLSVAPKWFVRDYLATKEIILSSWFNLLLVFVPLGWASAYFGWGPVPTFSLVSHWTALAAMFMFQCAIDCTD